MAPSDVEWDGESSSRTAPLPAYMPCTAATAHMPCTAVPNRYRRTGAKPPRRRQPPVHRSEHLDRKAVQGSCLALGASPGGPVPRQQLTGEPSFLLAVRVPPERKNPREIVPGPDFVPDQISVRYGASRCPPTSPSPRFREL